MLKIAIFAYSTIIVDLYSGGTSNNIKVIYTSLKSTFCGLQFCRRQYGSTFIRVVIVNLLPSKSEKLLEIGTYCCSRSSKVIDLDANRKHAHNFLFLI